jgi:uncharacterized protein (TIGR02270 family)
MEVHLEEATFLWALWEQALWAPDYVLEEVEQGEERRLLAHVDGLVLGGRPVAKRLLLPALEGEEVMAISAAALALLGAEDADGRQQVLELLTEGAEEIVEGVRRAVELSPREELTPALLKLLPGVQAEDEQARVLSVLRFRQADVSPALGGLKLGESAAVRAAAVRAARFASPAISDGLIRLGLADREPAVRDAALEAGLVLGRRDVWSRCRKLVEAGGEVPRMAMLALAVGGEPRDVELLVAALEDPALRDEALWALGFSGRLAAADAAFQILQIAGDRLATESFAAITGLPLAAPFIEEEEEEKTPEEEAFDEELAEAEADESEEEEDAEAGEVPSDAELLPGPAVALPGKVLAERIERWWAAERKRFEPSGRYLRGQALSVEVVRAAMESEPLHRRPVLGWEVAIRSRGACQLESRTWAHVQRRQLRAAVGLRSDALLRSFDRLLTG